jgi:hypothetical protein
MNILGEIEQLARIFSITGTPIDEEVKAEHTPLSKKYNTTWPNHKLLQKFEAFEEKQPREMKEIFAGNFILTPSTNSAPTHTSLSLFTLLLLLLLFLSFSLSLSL